MEETLSVAEVVQPRPSVRKWQHIAALLLMLPVCYSFIDQIFGIAHMFLEWGVQSERYCSFLEAVLAYETITTGIFTPILICAWLILYRIATNRPTRVAAIIMCILPCVSIGFGVFLGGIHYPLYYCLQAYAFALVLSNNELSEKNRSWITLGVVFYAIFAAPIFISIFSMGLSDRIHEHYSTMTLGISLVKFVIPIFWMIVYWKLAHSEAFSGQYNKTEVSLRAYSPLNRYMAGWIVATLLMTGICLLLVYYATDINEFFY